jgi:hypothetical protein
MDKEADATHRELIRAKLRADTAYNNTAKRNSNIPEDDRIDLEIETRRLMREMFAADDALFRYEKQHRLR